MEECERRFALAHVTKPKKPNQKNEKNLNRVRK
jgi:hypothetical protein